MRRLWFCLLLIATLGLGTGPAGAQAEPHLTPLITQTAAASSVTDAPAEATPEATPVYVTMEAPVASDWYYAMIDRVTVIFLALVGVGGAVAGVGLWRIVGIGITVAEIIAMITPDKRDDAEVAKWRAAYDEKMAATAAAGGVRAEIEREKDRLRESAAAKAANLDLNDPKYKG